MKKEINILNKMILKIAAGLGAICCGVVMTGTGSSIYAQSSAVTASGKNVVNVNGDNLKSFSDDYFAESMKEYNVPGAAIVVVKDGEEIFSSYYGEADVENNIPVDENTVFPACSVSKLYTATAIMQLYEDGKIDLDEDITSYVPDVHIHELNKEKVTCAELLTHSAGLDEASEVSGSTLDKSKIRSQSEYFNTHIPTLIRKPGTSSSYSNMGYNLLGYIVETVSGESYEDYVSENILKPLGMNASSVRIDDGNRCRGYYYEEGKYAEQGFAYQYTSGSSGVLTTMHDMGKFMMMHLANGTYGQQEILGEDTAEEMKAEQFANNSLFDGMGYGFIRTHFGDVSVVKHEGALPGYATTLMLIPDENIGVYVATNNTTGICFDFEEKFMRQFYGDEAVEGAESYENAEACSISADELKAYEGTYRSYDGIGKRNLMKFGILFDDTDMSVTKKNEDTLHVSYCDQKKETVQTDLKYCGNNVFVRSDGKGYITFNMNEDGSKALSAYTQVSHAAYERISFFEKKSVLALGLLALFMIMASITAKIIMFVRGKYAGGKNKIKAAAWLAGQAFTVLNVIGISFVTIMMVGTYDYSAVPMVKLMIFLLQAGVVLMIADCIIRAIDVVINIRGTIAADKSFSQKGMIIGNIVMLTCQLLFIIELWYFNFIGMHLFY